MCTVLTCTANSVPGPPVLGLWEQTAPRGASPALHPRPAGLAMPCGLIGCRLPAPWVFCRAPVRAEGLLPGVRHVLLCPDGSSRPVGCFSPSQLSPAACGTARMHKWTNLCLFLSLHPLPLPLAGVPHPLSSPRSVSLLTCMSQGGACSQSPPGQLRAWPEASAHLAPRRADRFVLSISQGSEASSPAGLFFPAALGPGAFLVDHTGRPAWVS